MMFEVIGESRGSRKGRRVGSDGRAGRFRVTTMREGTSSVEESRD